jgi:hypothetical protein
MPPEPRSETRDYCGTLARLDSMVFRNSSEGLLRRAASSSVLALSFWPGCVYLRKSLSKTTLHVKS